MVSEVTTSEISGSNAFLSGSKGKKEEKSDLSVSEQFLQLFNSSIFTGIDKEALTSNSKSAKAFDSIFSEKAVDYERQKNAKDYSAETTKTEKKEESSINRYEAKDETKTRSNNVDDSDENKRMNSSEATSEKSKVSKTDKTAYQEQRTAGKTSTEVQSEKTNQSEEQQGKVEAEKNPLQEAIRETRKRQRSTEQQTEPGVNKADDSARQSGLASIVAAANKRTGAKSNVAATQNQAVNAAEANVEAKAGQAVQSGAESQNMNQSGQQQQNAALAGQASIKTSSAQTTAKTAGDFNTTLKATSVHTTKGSTQTSQNPGVSASENKAAAKASSSSKTRQLVKANQTEIIQKLVRSAKMNLQNGKQEIKMILKPEELGWLKVKMNLQGQKVTAVITAENEEVKQMLEKNIGQLQTSLQSNHLRVNQVVVEVSGQNQPTSDMNKGGNDLMQQNQNHSGNSSNSKEQNIENNDLILSEEDQLTHSLAINSDGAVNVTI